VTRASSSDFDLAIIGGGMVGASLALALSGSRRRVLLVESIAADSSAQPSFDERTTALGNASRRIFAGLGLWPALAPAAAAIRTIHVSDAGRFGFARLRACEQGIDAFGYVLANRSIGSALWQQLGRAPGISLRVPAQISELEITPARTSFCVEDAGGRRERVSSQLLVAADGAHSAVRAAAGIAAQVEDYQQVALVANVAADQPHQDCAYERFTAQGPLALLPLADGSRALIWACAPERAAQLLRLPPAEYLTQLQRQFGWRAGRFLRLGRRGSYPLALSRAATPTGVRTVVIGNAAQALHPVAGQGFNLGLRDAAMLAEVLAGSGGDAGAPQLLADFAAWRARDRAGVVRFTDGLIRLFGSRRAGVGALRDLGLLLFDLSPPAKSALARVSSGFGGPAPRLARGLSLQHDG
jgi:2-octaprenyl-6-methoxyphenol hydroxylase